MELELITSTAIALRSRLLEEAGMAADLSLLDEFIRKAPASGPLDHYKVFTAEGKQLLDKVCDKHGESGKRIFLRAAILHGLAQTTVSPRFLSLPARLIAQQLSQFKRIVADTNIDAEWLRLDHDLFHKEFGIATLRLYVAGSQLVDPHCGIPRSLLLRGSPVNWLRNVAAFAKLGGFQPYFQIHTHQLMLDTFNPEGWNECYRCCADLYEVYPAVLGMYGGSWFYDPALATVSPRLSYLREVPQQGGAHLFYVVTGGSALDNSLATSTTRKQLYDAGKYMPKNYMLVWGKAEQRAWAHGIASSGPVTV